VFKVKLYTMWALLSFRIQMVNDSVKIMAKVSDFKGGRWRIYRVWWEKWGDPVVCCTAFHRAEYYATRSWLSQSSPSAPPFVRLSVKRGNCNKTKQTSAHIIIPYERSMLLSFPTPRVVGRRCPLLAEILGQINPHPSKCPCTFTRYLLSCNT